MSDVPQRSMLTANFNSGPVMENNSVKVWDLPVRLFHWSLVAFFTLAYFTGEDENQWHIYAGYAVLGLVLLRILWGFIGTQHARFSDFIYSPATVSTYMKGLRSANPKRCLGHTPPGGWMIVALLVGLLLTTLSGLKVYGLEGHGPLAANPGVLALISPAYADDDEHQHDSEHEDEHGYDSKSGSESENENEGGGEENEAEETWEEIHEFLSNLTVILVFIHIGGVLVSSRLHKENLVKAMITGKKKPGNLDASV